MAASIKLALASGLYRMGVRSDDGFKVTVTTNAAAPWTNAPQNEIQLAVFNGARGNVETAFDFVVLTNGVYNFRLLYEQGGGGAACEWYWVDRRSGARRLINQPPIPASYAAAPSGRARPRTPGGTSKFTRRAVMLPTPTFQTLPRAPRRNWPTRS